MNSIFLSLHYYKLFDDEFNIFESPLLYIYGITFEIKMILYLATFDRFIWQL